MRRVRILAGLLSTPFGQRVALAVVVLAIAAVLDRRRIDRHIDLARRASGRAHERVGRGNGHRPGGMRVAPAPPPPSRSGGVA